MIQGQTEIFDHCGIDLKSITPPQTLQTEFSEMRSMCMSRTSCTQMKTHRPLCSKKQNKIDLIVEPSI